MSNLLILVTKDIKMYDEKHFDFRFMIVEKSFDIYYLVI